MNHIYAFVINSLGRGGAERVLIELIRAANGTGGAARTIHVILLDREAEARTLPAGVAKHVLDSRGSLIRSIFGLWRCLRRIEPEVTISFLVRANVATAIACRLLGRRSVLCERMHLSSHLAGRYRGIRLLVARALPRLAYRLATRVTGVSRGVTEDLVANFGVDAAKTATIVNPYDFAAIEAASRKTPAIPLPARFIVAVGRLERSKAIDLLVDAYATADIAPDLVILGEGAERAALAAQVAALGIAERVMMPGFVANPYAVMARAEFYVSASRNEGFPNAMVEAMGLGRAVVASDCHSGPAEILAGVVKLGCESMVLADYGVLIPQDDGPMLVQALRAMANDDGLRSRYGDLSRERAHQFSSEAIARATWALFDEVADQARDRSWHVVARPRTRS